MATTKLYLDTRYKTKDGHGTVIINISHHGTACISTGIRLAPDEWDGTKAINREDSKTLNLILSKKKGDVDSSIAVMSLRPDFEHMTASDIRKRISGKDIRRKQVTDVSSVFAEYMKRPMKNNTRDIYLRTLRKVISFGGEHLSIKDVDLRWLTEFDAFLAKTQCANGKSVYLRALRAVCYYAKKLHYIMECPFESFTIRTEPTRKRSVSVETLRELLNFKVDPCLQKSKDMFFLMLYLIGINAVDLFNARPFSINGERLEYTRAKTGKKYSLKIEPEAMQIINKYRGTNYLLDIMDNYSNYKTYLRKMNNDLKKVGSVSWEIIPDENDLFAKPKLKKVFHPVVPGVSSYYSRHCWATIACELDISVDTISQAMGHSTNNRTTMIYIKYDHRKVDAANRKVIDSLVG